VHHYNEAGRRVLSAVLSYQLGIQMDYCLRKYVPEEVDSGWAELAETLLRGMSEGIVSKILFSGPSEQESKITLDLSKLKLPTNKLQ
jgi:hypothetical protein